MPQIRMLLRKSPAMAFTTVNEIAAGIGRKHGIVLSLNFPQRGKMEDFESYGKENIGMVFHRESRKFPIPREKIKAKALELLESPNVEDAYMYEGKEGVRVFTGSVRLDVLPASLHIWGRFDDKIATFCDWLLINCYEVSPGVDGAFSDAKSKV